MKQSHQSYSTVSVVQQTHLKEQLLPGFSPHPTGAIPISGRRRPPPVAVPEQVRELFYSKPGLQNKVGRHANQQPGAEA